MPSVERKKFLGQAASRYRKNLPDSPAVAFLATRGLADIENLEQFCLGYVADPLPGHERYAGMLAIPYLRWSPGSGWMVVSMRYRCVQPDCTHEGHGKYLSEPGDEPRMYNTVALHETTDTIAVCEGEIDAITATLHGIPAVGVAGSHMWQRHYPYLFAGYERVLILADGDEAGSKFATTVANELTNAHIIPSADGEDVNSEIAQHGGDMMRQKVYR